MMSGSPCKFLHISDKEMLQTCLSKAPVTFLNEELKETGQLKRKRADTEDPDGIPPKKKRVSFGGARFINEFNEISEQQDDLQVLPSHSLDEYLELTHKIERLEREVEILEANATEQHSRALESTTLGYNSLLDALNTKLGINPKAPSDGDVAALLAKNDEQFQVLKELEATLAYETQRHISLINAAEEEIHKVEEELHISKSTKDTRSQEAKLKLARQRGELNMYASMTRIELSRISDNQFRGKALKTVNEHLTFDIHTGTTEKTHEPVLHYSKVSTTIPRRTDSGIEPVAEVEGFLNTSITNITEAEVPLLFRRLLSLVNN